MKQPGKKVTHQGIRNRLSDRMFSTLAMFLLGLFIISGTAFGYSYKTSDFIAVNSSIDENKSTYQSVETRAVAIFTGISIAPYMVEANIPTTVHIEANHYGRPIVNIPCTYDFYVVNYETKQTVELVEGYNQKEVTHPSNAGRLRADIEINLPAGHYSLYYIYKGYNYTEGPFSFSDFWVGERPPKEQKATISLFSIRESCLSVAISGANQRYAEKYGDVDNEAGTITLTMTQWHNNFRNADAKIILDDQSSSFTIGSKTYKSGSWFTTDFTQPVTITVKSEDESVTKEYTITATNATANDKADLLTDIEFYYNDKSSGHQYVCAVFDKESGEYIMDIPSKLSDIDQNGFAGVIGTSLGASVTINGEELTTVYWYDGTYNAHFGNISPTDTYVISIISADGTATNEYTIRTIVKPEPSIWIDENYCGGFFSRSSGYHEINSVIPVSLLREVGFYINEGFFEELFELCPPSNGHLILRQEGGMEYPIDHYPQDHPWIPENEIWFPEMDGMGITSGRYNVVLHLAFDPTEEEPWPSHQDYILGNITLTDEVPVNRSISLANFTNGRVICDKTIYPAGMWVMMYLADITEGYELATIEVFKTGDENTKVEVDGYGTSNSTTRYFLMPDFDVTVTATFQQKKQLLDTEAVEAAKTKIESGIYVIYQTDANTEAEVKASLVTRINNSISSLTGITITADDITVSDFKPATNGNEGSFNFIVRFAKGNASDSVNKSGRILVSSSYNITIGTFTGGSVTANPITATENENISLTILPETGYELESIAAYKTDNNEIPVMLTGTDNNRTFEMPRYGVTITAKFRMTQAQEDKVAVETAKSDIEGGSYGIAQSVGSTEAAIKAWLIRTLNAMFGRTHNIEFRASETPIVGSVTVTYITPPIAGTKANPNGTDGSFTFTVALTSGATVMTTETASGVIKATPYTEAPPPPRITYTITASAKEGGSINPSGSMTIDKGSNRAFTFTPNNGYEIAEVIVDGNNIPQAATTGSYTFEYVTGDHTIEVSFHPTTPTGIAELQSTPLTVYVQNGILYISGLIPGQPWSLYNFTGLLIRQGIAVDMEEQVKLPSRGVYIVKSVNRSVKIVY